MPRTVQLKTNFVSGEQDPLLRSRSDIKHYYNGAQYLRNVIVLPQGGVRSKPGTQFLFEVPLIPEIDGGGISVVRMAEVQYSTDQTYLFLFHHKKLTIFVDGVAVQTLTSPFSSSELRAVLTAEGDLISTGISWTQTRDTMIVFHQDYQPKRIKRGATHDSWAISDFAFKNIPNFNFGDVTYINGVNEVQKIEFPQPGSQGDWTAGDTFKLILEDETTSNIVWTNTIATMATNIQTALRRLANVSATGITVTPVGATTAGGSFTVTFAGDEGQRPWGSMGYDVVSAVQVPTINITMVTDGEYAGEPVWSPTRGWPRCGTIFQGRLWMAGTKFLPNTLWASRAGAAEDFNNKKIDDDYGIQATSDTDDVPAFCAIFAGRHLQIFSTSAEFYVPASESDAVTPANIVLRRSTSCGMKAGLRVFQVEGATHFVQRRGRALREFLFADTELAYQANNVSLLASHLMRDPVSFALRRSSSTEDADYEFMPNSDGTMTVFCTLRTQDVNAMTLWSTEGLYDDVAVVLDKVYFSVLRTIDGVQRKYIEVMNDDLSIDCAKFDFALGAPASGITVAHLPNTTIEVNLDSVPQEAITSDGAGAIVFAREAETSYVAGLRYPDCLPEFPGFIWLVRTLPIELDLPEGAAFGKKRRIVNLTMRLYETTALRVNNNDVSFQQFGAHLLDQPVVPFTGIKQERGFLGWDYEGSIVLGSDVSTKATILGLAWAVSV